MDFALATLQTESNFHAVKTRCLLTNLFGLLTSHAGKHPELGFKSIGEVCYQTIVWPRLGQ